MCSNRGIAAPYIIIGIICIIRTLPQSRTSRVQFIFRGEIHNDGFKRNIWGVYLIHILSVATTIFIHPSCGSAYVRPKKFQVVVEIRHREIRNVMFIRLLVQVLWKYPHRFSSRHSLCWQNPYCLEVYRHPWCSNYQIGPFICESYIPWHAVLLSSAKDTDK